MPFKGAKFRWLAANVVSETTGKRPCRPIGQEVKMSMFGFIGMTLEATDTLVAAVGIQGWDFLDEADTATPLSQS